MITIPKVVLGLIFRDYIPFEELKSHKLVCRLFREVIHSKMVGTPTMKREGIPFVENESWWVTYFKPKIIICLDISGSMDQWRSSTAAKEVNAIAFEYLPLAGERGIYFMPFGSQIETIRIKNVDEIAMQIADVVKRLGLANRWDETFNGISQEISNSVKTIVFIVSDFDGAYKNHVLWNTAYKIPPRIYLCRMGDGGGVDDFINDLIKTDSSKHDDAEPTAKKRKKEGNTQVFYKHFTTDGKVVEYLPSQDPNDEPIFEEVEEEEQSIPSADIEDDIEYYPPADYMDEYSSED